jgi:hypothetical protein
MGGWMGGWVDEWMDGWMDGFNAQSSVHSVLFFLSFPSRFEMVGFVVGCSDGYS